MTATPREVMYQTLACEGPARAPRQLWALPWPALHHPAALRAIRAAYPDDIGAPPVTLGVPYRRKQGDPHAVGTATDAWGCVFVNIQQGIIGEVRDPIVRDWAADRARVHIPREELTFDADAVNRFCDESDLFLMAACCPRPFEQLQFIMGTAALYMELMEPSAAFQAFLREMHGFYCELAERWMKETRVDALFFMDDWGSQQDLLISPSLWCDVFKPLYRDYIDIAHAHGKKAFMHSDGQILKIYPHLVELGVDALNSQIFCMGIENLEPFAGHITFWGEMDRQQLLVHATPEEIATAVERVHRILWRNGGCIAQCEFGLGARPENVRQVFASWDRLTARPAQA
ncbi:MAG: methyltransferase [Candidatus Marinimicrobia bacterium]|nr:methyltransferase [Candidatus Neomarinimicrobiota bacterium]